VLDYADHGLAHAGHKLCGSNFDGSDLQI